MSLLNNKSSMALYYGLTDQSASERATAQLLAVFENLYSSLERHCAEKSALPVRGCNIPIRWFKTGPLPVEIKTVSCAPPARH